MSAILTDEVVEAAAKNLFFEQCSIMHDHEFNWKACPRKALFRDCARAALLAALPYIGEACARMARSIGENCEEDGGHLCALEIESAIRAATKENSHG